MRHQYAAYIFLFLVFGAYLAWAVGYFLTSTVKGTCNYDDATYDLFEILCEDVSYLFCSVTTTSVCDHIHSMNDDTATVMVDSVIIAVVQLLYVLYVTEMHFKFVEITQDHVYAEAEDPDLITGIHHVPGATNVIEDEEDEEDEPPKSIEEPQEPAAEEEQPEEEAPEEEEEEEAPAEEAEDEEEVM